MGDDEVALSEVAEVGEHAGKLRHVDPVSRPRFPGIEENGP